MNIRPRPGELVLRDNSTIAQLIPTALKTDSLAPVYRIEKTGDSRPLRESTVRAVGITPARRRRQDQPAR